jgi:hypothetical protein
MPLVLNGTTGVQDNSGALVSGTAVASTSGTSIDFTSIPSWVKRISIMFRGVSTNGSSFVQVQIGSGSVTTSGYLCSSQNFYVDNGYQNISATSGFIFGIGTGASTQSGLLVITLLGSNTYVASGYTTANGAGGASCNGNSPALSGVLDRVRITTVNGTDTFDAGSINILYE